MRAEGRLTGPKRLGEYTLRELADLRKARRRVARRRRVYIRRNYNRCERPCVICGGKGEYGMFTKRGVKTACKRHRFTVLDKYGRRFF
jgi:hypothetical protein